MTHVELEIPHLSLVGGGSLPSTPIWTVGAGLSQLGER